MRRPVPRIAAAVTDTTGVALSDTDDDGLPDSAAQVAAVYEHTYGNGVVNDAGQTVFAGPPAWSRGLRDRWPGQHGKCRRPVG